MEEFETSSKLGFENGGVRAKFAAWNRKWRSLSQVQSLESEIEEFEPSSDSWNRKWKSLRQVRGLESEMKEFEPSSDASDREWKCSSQVGGLKSGM